MSNKKASRPAATAANAKIGFIGAGKLPEAIINGLVKHSKVEPSRIFVAAPSTANTDRLKDNFKGLKTTKTNNYIFGRFDCDVVFIAVNGNVIRNLYKLGGNRPAALTTNYIPNMKHPFFVLSLVSGFDIKHIKEVLLNPEHPNSYAVAMHRIVLNCAVAFGKGVGAADIDPTSPKFPKTVFELIKPMTTYFESASDKEMDAVCSLVGAGLSFCYYFINAIADGSLKIGLSRSQAVKWAAKTAKCASETLVNTDRNVSQLKDEVCAPSGAAIYGLSIMDKAEVGPGVMAAVEAAHKRARELAAAE